MRKYKNIHYAMMQYASWNNVSNKTNFLGDTKCKHLHYLLEHLFHHSHCLLNVCVPLRQQVGFELTEWEHSGSLWKLTTINRVVDGRY